MYKKKTKKSTCTCMSCILCIHVHAYKSLRKESLKCMYNICILSVPHLPTFVPLLFTSLVVISCFSSNYPCDPTTFFHTTCLLLLKMAKVHLPTGLAKITSEVVLRSSHKGTSPRHAQVSQQQKY